MTTALKEWPAGRLARIDNTSCIYCFREFGPGRRRTEEHVVGRRFVPKGTLAAQWNLIAWACEPCNEEKSRLENDLSAITIRPDLLGRFESEERAVAEARRKESSRSHRSGKAVGDSDEDLKVTLEPMPGVTMSANLLGGPQLDSDRAFRLAMWQIAAFFYWITFDREQGRGSALPGSFAPISVVARSDWGNQEMVGFQEMISEWAHRIHAVGADGYFKVMIRRRLPESDDPPLWAWALEWNRNYRLVGFFGDGSSAQDHFDRLPVLKKNVIERTREKTTTMRMEVPLPEEADHLFAPPATT